MRGLWCRLRGHARHSLAHRHKVPYLLDGVSCEAEQYELTECARCGLLEEFAVVLMDERDIDVGTLLVSMLERRELACLEDAQAWNQGDKQ